MGINNHLQVHVSLTSQLFLPFLIINSNNFCVFYLLLLL